MKREKTILFYTLVCNCRKRLVSYFLFYFHLVSSLGKEKGNVSLCSNQMPMNGFLLKVPKRPTLSVVGWSYDMVK